MIKFPVVVTAAKSAAMTAAAVTAVGAVEVPTKSCVAKAATVE